MIDTRPLVLLDVDGVVHDREARDAIRLADDQDAAAADLGVIWVAAGGIRVAIPHSVAAIVRGLAAATELWWCSTWGERANDHLAPALSIDPLPVIGAGTHGAGLAWKEHHARPVVRAALDDGRRVVWIEDFDGRLPGIGGVEYVDTAETGLIRAEELPAGLLP